MDSRGLSPPFTKEMNLINEEDEDFLAFVMQQRQYQEEYEASAQEIANEQAAIDYAILGWDE